MDNRFINDVTRQIKNKNEKQNIEAELSSHIFDKIDFYVDIGYTKEQAEKMATEDMGDPEQTAVPLNSLHNIKWYTQFINWITVVLLLGELVITYFYGYYFVYSSKASLIHYVTTDFASLIMFGIITVLIHIGRKNKNKFVLFSVSIYFFLQIFLVPFDPLEPMFYSVVKIFNEGFSGYTNSLFSYGLVGLYSYDGFFSTASLLVSGITLVYCGLALLGIMAQERALTRKSFWKPYKIFERIAVCLLALNFTVMSGCTAVAYINLDTKIQENIRLRSDEINFILNTDVSKSAEEICKDFHSAGYFPLYSGRFDVYGTTTRRFDKDNTRLEIYNLYDEFSSVNFAVVSAHSKFSPLNKNMSISEKDLDVFKEDMYLHDYYPQDNENLAPTIYRSDQKTVSLQDFLDMDFYTNAYFVEKSNTVYSEDGENILQVTFWFYLEDSPYETVYMMFREGYLEELQFWYSLEDSL